MKTYAVDVHWDVAKCYDIEANSKEEAEKKIWDMINSGGEGKSPLGMPSPVTPWGKPALGHKTRNKRKSNKMIIKRVN